MDLYDLFTEKAAKIGVPTDRKFVWIEERVMKIERGMREFWLEKKRGERPS